jgi:hypothetical protein
MGFAYSLPWQSNGQRDNSQSRDQRLADQRPVRGVQRPAVLGDGRRRALNTPSNQDADLVGTFNVLGNTAPPASGSTPRVAQPTACVSALPNRNQFYGPGGYNLDFSIFRAFPFAGTRRFEFRMEAGNLFNHGVYNNPNGSFTSATFGQITGVRAEYPERQIRLGFRVQF